MSRLEADGIPSADLHFVFIGDPSLPDGIWPNLVPDLDSLLGSSLTNTLLTDLGFDGVLGNLTPDDLVPDDHLHAGHRWGRRVPTGLQAGGLLGPDRGPIRPARGVPGVDTDARSLTRPRRPTATSPMSTSPTTSITSTRGSVRYSSMGPPAADYSRASSTLCNCISPTRSDLIRGRTRQRSIVCAALPKSTASLHSALSRGGGGVASAVRAATMQSEAMRRSGAWPLRWTTSTSTI